VKKTRAWFLGTFAAAGASAIAVAVTLGTGACSSNEVTPIDSAALADAAAGGDGSASDGGPTNADASNTDSGFLELDAGPVDAGQCTDEPMFEAGFHASCSTCMAASCCAQVKNCDGVPDCVSFAQCYAGCELDGGGQGACTTFCIAGKDGGAIQQVYFALIKCGNDNCHNDGGTGVADCPF
jgi:hypothetical protein